MTILKSVKQINDLVNKIFGLENGFGDEDYSLLNDIISKDAFKEKKTKKVVEIGNDIEDLSLLVFQLSDYIPALCNITNLMLQTQSYDAIYFFVSKIFYEHIGTVYYQSSEKSYNYSQRLFDRFVEIIKNCNLDKQDYIPFLIYVFECEPNNKLSQWQEPALEYLKKFEHENQQWVGEFIKNDENGIKMLYLLCLFATQKGLKYAVDFFDDKNCEVILEMLKDFKKDILLYIDKELPDSTEKQRAVFGKILLSWGEDNDAKSRLEEVYKTTTDQSLRNEISRKIGGVNQNAFKNEKNYLFAVRRNIKDPQERTLGMPFDKCNLTYLSGLKCDFASYTYLIQIFKEENNVLNIEKFLCLKNVFQIDTLSKFATDLFFRLSKKEDINCAKWAIRLCALFADLDILFGFTKVLFEQNRIKEAKYLLTALIYSKRDVMQLLKNLNQCENFLPHKQYFLDMYAKANDIDQQIVSEQLVPDFWTKSIYQKEFENLYQNFLAGRMYTQEYFSHLFEDNKLYNSLAQNIVFGEYKFGRLYSAFILVGKNKTFVYGSHISDSQISIIHTIDCDERTRMLFDIFPDSEFKQFETSYFDVNNFSRNQVSIQSFLGTVVDPQVLYEKLKPTNFTKNKTNGISFYTSLIHKMPILNLVCELEFDSQVNDNTSFATLSNIYFYRLRDCLESNGKLLTEKQNAISIGSLPARYFSHILTAIAIAVGKQ